MFLNHIILLCRFVARLKESLIALFISALTAVFAGLFLGTAQEVLILVPGIILLVPAAIGMRGNIFAALGSRLGSALHLGSVTSFTIRNKVVRSNIYSTLTLTLILSAFLGFLAKGFAVLFGLKSISVFSFVAISFIAGFLSGVILLFLTFLVSFASYRRGWDPDNITSPIITALGDFFTIPSLLLATYFVTSIDPNAINAIAYLAVIASGLNILFIFIQKARNRSVQYRKIVLQSLVILVLAGALDGFAGAFIELNIHTIISLPMVIVMLPAFLETGGNIGNVLAARLSTKLHLGTIQSFRFTPDLKREILGSMTLAYITFPVLGLLTYIVSSLFGVTGLTLTRAVLLSTVGGIILHLIIIFFTMFTAILSFKYGLDPDNVTIPLLTSATDIIGVLALFAALSVLAIL